MSVNTTRDLSSPFFLDAALVGERTTGMEVAALQHDGCLPKMKSTVPLATAVPSRKGHAGGGVELFKLDYMDNLWVYLYCSDGLWFSSAPFRCVCCGGGIICARIDGLQ